MSFGDDDNVSPPTPQLAPPAPAAPTFASGIGRLQRGQPRGGTLLTNPLAPASTANTIKRSLVTL